MLSLWRKHSKKFLEQVHASCNRWFRVPVGNLKASAFFKRNFILMDASFWQMEHGVPCPEIKFQQRKTDHSCYFSAAANAFYYKGQIQLANILKTNFDKSSAHYQQTVLLKSIIQEEMVKWYRNVQITYSKEEDCFDVLKSPLSQKSNVVIIMTLRDGHKDGGVRHAAEVSNNWYFDSTLETAVPLQLNALHYSCQGKFGNVHSALVVTFSGMYKGNDASFRKVKVKVSKHKKRIKRCKK